MPRCFIAEPVNASKPQIADASEFGEMVYLFPKNEKRPSTFDTDGMADAIADKLEVLAYDPAIDFIVVGGGLVINCALCAVIGVAYGDFKVLIFDINKRKYVEGRLG